MFNLQNRTRQYFCMNYIDHMKKLSVQSDKMSDRSTEITIWMSHQIMGKTSRPDKQGMGEIEGGKFTDKNRGWEEIENWISTEIPTRCLWCSEIPRFDQISLTLLPQRRTKTQENILYPIYSQRNSLVIQINMKIWWYCESCEVIGLKKFCICWGK